MTDFSMISACGECCTGCRKKPDGSASVYSLKKKKSPASEEAGQLAGSPADIQL